MLRLNSRLLFRSAAAVAKLAAVWPTGLALLCACWGPLAVWDCPRRARCVGRRPLSTDRASSLSECCRDLCSLCREEAVEHKSLLNAELNAWDSSGTASATCC
jgi:hypothetical protein